MRIHRVLLGALGLAPLFLAGAGSARAHEMRPLPYNLLYVRAPYCGDGPQAADSSWPDTVQPLTPDPGAQLARLDPTRATGIRLPP